MDRKEKIVGRIKALLSKTGDNGASDAEAQTAMNIAASLMEKHHLTEEDIDHEPADDYSKVDPSTFNEQRSFCGSTIFAWENFLATFVTSFVGCPSYTDKTKRPVRKNGLVKFENDEPLYGASIVFYGVPEDAAIAVEIYDELRMLIASMAVGRWGTIYRGNGAAYAEGFVSGLYTKLEISKNLEMQTAQTSTSLTLIHRRADLIQYKADKAKVWLEKSKGWKLQKGSVNGSSASKLARREGYVDGQNTDVEVTRRRKIGV